MATSLEDDGVTDMGISDETVFAIYKGNMITVDYDKNNILDTIARFELEAKQFIPDQKIIDKIKHELNLIHIGLLEKEESENKVLSISEAVKLSKGTISVKGIITGKSEPFMIIVSGTGSCTNCDTKDTTMYFDPPLLIPTSQSKKCSNCKELSMNLEYEYVTAIKVKLRDEDVFNDVEIRTVMWGDDVMNIGYGETGIVKGAVHVLQMHGKYSSLLPYIFSNSIKHEFKKEIIITKSDEKAFENFVKYPNIIERLTAMFAPNVIGEESKKLPLLRSMVNASADKYKPTGSEWSSIISTFMIGDPGGGKTMLAKECVKVIPNSKYAGSQNATGLSLTAMIDVENDTKILKYGPIPLSKHAICVINEFGRMDFKDQGHILDVMGEKSITMSKYGTHREIPAPTTIIATLNQSGTEWRHPDKIDIDEIPILRQLTDRADQILISRESRSKQDRLEYAESKRGIHKRREHNYNFLSKYLIYASRLQPTFTNEAEDLINQFWKDMDNMQFGGGNRNLDSIYRIAEAHARLRLSKVVDKKIANETLEYYETMLSQFGKIVMITEDVRKTAIDAITRVIKRNPMAITFKDAVEFACEENERVRNYIITGEIDFGTFTSRGNFKFREVYERFKQVKDSHIHITKDNPLTCIWQRDACDVCDEGCSPTANFSFIDTERSTRTLEKNNLYPHSPSSHPSHTSHSTNNIHNKIDNNDKIGTEENRDKFKFIKCPKCRFENIHLDVIVHHIRFTEDHDLSLISKLKGGEAVLIEELGIKNKIKIVDRGSDSNYSKSYNGINIIDVNQSESGSVYIRHHYCCTECNFKSWVYDDAFRHLMNHLDVCIELEYLKNKDYVEALKILDNHVDIKRSYPMFTNFALRIARETFVKYNSMNQRYFKKLLPKGEAVIIQDSDIPVWKTFIKQIRHTQNPMLYDENEENES